MAVRVEVEPVAQRSPLLWACGYATITPAGQERQPFNPYPYQEEFLVDRAPRRVVLKARQVGMSQVIALEALHRALFWPHSTVLFVSRNGAMAQYLLNYVSVTAAGLEGGTEVQRQNLTEMVLANGSWIVSLPANPDTGRGIAANYVYLDEHAYMQYAEQIWVSVAPTLSHDEGRMTVLSTPNGRGNLFYRLWAGIEGGEGWSRHHVRWQDCPRYTAEWYERERPKYTAEQWASDFDCDFVISGAAVFDQQFIDAMAWGAVGEQGALGGREYVTGWDIGRRKDATVGITVDVTAKPYQVVKYERFLQYPYPLIQQKIEERDREYGGELLVESSGPGDPVIENLACPARAFATARKNKTDAITNIARLLENGELKAKGPVQLLGELAAYQWDDEDIVQDSVMALAIALSDTRERWLVA